MWNSLSQFPPLLVPADSLCSSLLRLVGHYCPLGAGNRKVYLVADFVRCGHAVRALLPPGERPLFENSEGVLVSRSVFWPQQSRSASPDIFAIKASHVYNAFSATDDRRRKYFGLGASAANNYRDQTQSLCGKNAGIRPRGCILWPDSVSDEQLASLLFEGNFQIRPKHSCNCSDFPIGGGS